MDRFCFIALFLFLSMPTDDACMQTIPALDNATTRVTIRSTSAATTTTTTTSTTTTTTTLTVCPSAAPLFVTGIFNPGDQYVQLLPAATAPIGSTITVNCCANAPVTGTQVFVKFDSGGPLDKQNIDNLHLPSVPAFSCEQFFMTCTASGLWNVMIISSFSGVPVSGIVSNPGNIFCIL